MASSGSSAASSTSSPPPQPTQSKRLPMPSRNPIPLSSSQEAQVREGYYKRVRDQCTQEIKDFAECATGLTFTATYRCRAQKLAMNGCMVRHATPDEEDRAREDWFALRGERKRETERREQVRKRQEDFHREWWEREEEERGEGGKKKKERSVRAYPT